MSADVTPAEVKAAEETAAEVKRRFADRSMLLCGGEFLATRRCMDPGASSRERQEGEVRKNELFECMSARVCEVLHGRLQQCMAANSDPEQCAMPRAHLHRCLQAAYLSLPEPTVSIGAVEARLKELGADVARR